MSSISLHTDRINNILSDKGYTQKDIQYIKKNACLDSIQDSNFDLSQWIESKATYDYYNDRLNRLEATNSKVQYMYNEYANKPVWIPKNDEVLPAINIYKSYRSTLDYIFYATCVVYVLITIILIAYSEQINSLPSTQYTFIMIGIYTMLALSWGYGLYYIYETSFRDSHGPITYPVGMAKCLIRDPLFGLNGLDEKYSWIKDKLHPNVDPKDVIFMDKNGVIKRQ